MNTPFSHQVIGEHLPTCRSSGRVLVPAIRYCNFGLAICPQCIQSRRQAAIIPLQLAFELQLTLEGIRRIINELANSRKLAPLMTLFSGVLGAIGTLFVPLPLAAAWPYLIASAGIHLAYMLFLVRAYRLGDLSRVYPIARGLAPVVVALMAALFVGERPTIAQAAGLLLCCTAIVSLAFADRGISQVSGRAVAALYLDEKRQLKSGQAFTCAELALHYGYTDVDGLQPPVIRSQEDAAQALPSLFNKAT